MVLRLGVTALARTHIFWARSNVLPSTLLVGMLAAVTLGDRFHRIEAVAKVGEKMKVLGLKDRDTRSAVRAWAGSVEGLHSEPAARAYV